MATLANLQPAANLIDPSTQPYYHHHHCLKGVLTEEESSKECLKLVALVLLTLQFLAG